MPISTEDFDQLITLPQACNLLPRNHNGKKVSIVTLWRWRNASGAARLETVTVGGRVYTTPAAIRAFIRARSQVVTAPSPPTGTADIRRRRVERGMRQRHGIDIES